MKYTNQHNIPTSVAVWLAHDSYDRVPGANYLSATDFNRPVRQIILARRPLVIAGEVVEFKEDLAGLIASRIGTSVHDSIEGVWTTRARESLENLGMNDLAKRVIVNPEPNQSLPDFAIPVYMEIRNIKDFNGYRIGGKFDFASQGIVEDFKTTKVFSYQKGGNVEDYTRQASIYRWLNPDIINEDYFRINYILTDWLQSVTLQDPNYPKCQVISKEYPLLSWDETEAMMAEKIAAIEKYKDSPEEEIPRCTDEELWRDPPKYKYFKNPQKLNRSTKNFDSMAEAQARLAQDGGVGTIQTHYGAVRRCNYCPAFQQCRQKNEYLDAGLLIPTQEVLS